MEQEQGQAAPPTQDDKGEAERRDVLDRKRGELPIRDHVLMVNDLARGEKYYQAMKAKIRRGDVVLEVGTGAGLLSCIAARLGAKHVYTVEGSPVMHGVARKVFEANGLSDRITLLNAHSKDLASLGAIQEPIDVFVTETIGTLGLEEGIVPIFEHVRPLLSPKAKIIPENVKFKQCLVNMSGIRDQAEILHPIFGFDLSALNGEVKSNQFYWMHPIEPWREVSTTAETSTYGLLDFESTESQQDMQIIANNVCDGMLTWAEFKLAKHVSIETRYRHFGDSWASSVHFMDRGVVKQGQSCTSRFRIADDKVSWRTSWEISPC
jgi:precorrin-6B methylase 2